MSELAEQYLRAVATSGFADLDLLPAVLSAACVEVLPVDGAGISITGLLRVPLGASGDDVRCAECLQSTLGEGPCIAASEQGAPLAADLTEIGTWWPLFQRELIAQTPYRSVVSLPLRTADEQPLGAVDLYFRAPEPDRTLLGVEVQGEVIDVITRLLLVPLEATALESEPRWMESQPVRRRMHVWAAVGMVMAVAGHSEADALAALRGYAFSQSSTLDAVAEAMVAREIDVTDLVG